MSITSQRPRKFVQVVALAMIVSSILVACSPRTEVRGNRADEERLSEIKPGEITREEVAEILGSPSNKSAFGQETWFYINETVETVAFFKPKVVDRRIVTMTFDETGTLASMALIDEKTGKEIQMVDRTTPTTGHEIGFFEQIFGNFGVFGN